MASTDWKLTFGARAADLPSTPYVGRHFIDGKWRDSGDSQTMARRSPAHDALVGQYAKGTADDARDAVVAARQAFDDGRWSRLSGKQRHDYLCQVAERIERDHETIAVQEVLESGKPITQARAEVSGAAALWRYAATLAWNVRGDSYNALGDDMLGLVMREPIGVVSIITPWNFPFIIAAQKLPFALAAGCTVALKPSELTSGTTVMLAGLLDEVGLPDGVVNVVLGEGDPVGAVLTHSDDVDMVSFTGSTQVGKEAVAASAGTLKKVSLELGGKNPQVIFPDADLEAAADAVVFGVYFNGGQCCNSSSRLLVHRDIAEEFTQRVVELSRQVPFGDPLDSQARVGAIISEAHERKIQGYVEQAVTQGATLRLGGRALQAPNGEGRYFEPTVVSGVSPDMEIARDEVFGPVLSALTFDTLDEAISITNDCLYGLSAGIWSRSIDNCLAYARRARAGTVWVNTWMDGYPELPFGGFKQSGLGRELGHFGLDEFTEQKTVQLHMGARTNWWVPQA
ncbi:aldehyde dehydrogenase family protein [Rhodovibrio salinarum]|uniref:Sorbosone dehydrogenase n=1 Tax=Rhodovibrio salinarum TaxID=1087 RepID=A0A934QHZ3_9PROT|nr:aldehyde dehydrogenase family protein [Rhodovibrio salinarum]MBK1697219.1 sorbosone dehydrogenase [Rhodovibrio salinarum]